MREQENLAEGTFGVVTVENFPELYHISKSPTVSGTSLCVSLDPLSLVCLLDA